MSFRKYVGDEDATGQQAVKVEATTDSNKPEKVHTDTEVPTSFEPRFGGYTFAQIVNSSVLTYSSSILNRPGRYQTLKDDKPATTPCFGKFTFNGE